MANEKRLDLLDRKTVLEEFCRYCIVGIEGNCPEGGCAEFRHISRLPTVDAVEVVRCKNCRSWTRNIENHKGYGTCYRRGFSKGVPTHEDGYCDGGIKRGESGEH